MTVYRDDDMTGTDGVDVPNAAAIGMSIGIGWYMIAVIASVYAVIVPRIPHVQKWRESQQDE